MTTGRKILIGGLIVVTSIAAFAYWQYKRLMDFGIGLKKIKAKSLSQKKFDLDLYLNFKNKSLIAFDFIEQEYSVYINNKFVTKATNHNLNQILAGTTSVIMVNVIFNPNDAFEILKKNWAAILLKPELVIIKIDMKLIIDLYGFKISIPYIYEDTLKAMMTTPPDEVTQNNTNSKKR